MTYGKPGCCHEMAYILLTVLVKKDHVRNEKKKPQKLSI